MKIRRPPPKETEQKVVAVFKYLDDLIAAIHSVKEKGHAIDTVYSPARIEAIAEALDAKPSPVRFFTLSGALIGILSGFGLAIYTMIQWRFIVQGRPVTPIPPDIIVAFELCILIGVFANLLGVVMMTRLPRLRIPKYYDIRFSADKFGLVVKCPGAQETPLAQLLTDSGAEDVYEAK